MIVATRVGDAEADRHFLEEARVWHRDAATAEVVRYGEHDLILTDCHLLAQQLRPAILARMHCPQQPVVPAVEDAEVHSNARGAGTVNRVEHMCRQTNHERLPEARSRLRK